MEFIVRSKPDLPADKNVFLAGNSPSLGPRRPDGLHFERVEKTNEWRGRFEGKKGEILNYKFTCGSWNSVESAHEGLEVANRKLELIGDTTIEVLVERWATTTSQLAHTALGDFRKLAVQEPSSNTSRTVTVWLPPNKDD